MPYKKKAPTKRTKKAVGGALLSAAQKRLLGQAQAGAVKKGAGAITKQMVNYTRKYGDQRKTSASPAKRKPTGSSSRAEAMMALGKRQRSAAAKGSKRTPTARGVASRGRRPAVGSTRPKTPAQRQALMKKRMEAMRQGRVVSTRPPSGRGRLTAAQRRARMASARRRAMAAARKRRAPSRRVKRPTRRPASSSRGLSRSAMLRARRGRSTPTRRRRVMRRR